MLSLLQKPAPSPEARVRQYFCVFCDARFLRSGFWRRHVELHFTSSPVSDVTTDSTGVSPAVSRWISAFLKSQAAPFTVDQLPARIRAYADCIVCRNFRDVGHPVTAPTCRFQKDIRNLENHLRSHLCYSSFYCRICCRKEYFCWDDTVVELRHSKRGRFFEIGAAIRPFLNLTSARNTVFDHLRSCHLIPTKHIIGKKIISSRDLIGDSPVPRLEQLVESVVSAHRQNLSTIRAVKKRDDDSPQVQQLKRENYDKLRKIRMQPEKSYFTISPEDDLMLDDINEIIREQIADDPLPVATPPLSSPTSDLMFSDVTSRGFHLFSEFQTPTLSICSSSVPSRPKRIRCSSPVSRDIRPASSASPASTPSFVPYIPLPMFHHQNSVRPVTRQSVRRQLSFGNEAGVSQSFQRLDVGPHKATRFRDFVDPGAPGVVEWEEPAEDTFTVPYSSQMQSRVDELLESAMREQISLTDLTADAVDDVLLNLSAEEYGYEVHISPQIDSDDEKIESCCPDP